VLSVVAAHVEQLCSAYHICNPSLFVRSFLGSCSTTGVAFFFVHTCLVLMLSLHRSYGPHGARNFLIRRIFRIYPLCWTVLCLVLTTGLTDLPDRVRELRWQDILANSLLVQNVIKTRENTSVLGPLWSLPWEMQMYLALPLLFLFLRRFQWLGTVFLIWLGTFLLAVVGTLPQVHHGWTVFPPMFIAGIVAYRLLIRAQPDVHRYALPAWGWPLLVMSLFVVVPLLAGNQGLFSTKAAVLNAGNCLLLGLAIPSFRELTAFWIVRPAEQIAKYSYGVYLFHVPAIVLCLRFLPRLPIVPKIALALVFTSAISFLAFHVIENPLIRIGKRLTPIDFRVRQAA